MDNVTCKKDLPPDQQNIENLNEENIYQDEEQKTNQLLHETNDESKSSFKQEEEEEKENFDKHKSDVDQLEQSDFSESDCENNTDAAEDGTSESQTHTNVMIKKKRKLGAIKKNFKKLKRNDDIIDDEDSTDDEESEINDNLLSKDNDGNESFPMMSDDDLSKTCESSKSIDLETATSINLTDIIAQGVELDKPVKLEDILGATDALCDEDKEAIASGNKELKLDPEMEFDITEKLREMGEISVKPVSKGRDGASSSRRSIDAGLVDELSVEITKRSPDSDKDESEDKRKITNLRKNIREVMEDNQLDASTLAAQRQELERLARVQEQQRIIREVQRQIALERQNSKTQTRVISLLQGNSSLLKNSINSAGSSKVTLPGSGGTVLVKIPASEARSRGLKFSDTIKTKTNLTPSVSIAPVKAPMKKELIEDEPEEMIDDDDDDEEVLREIEETEMKKELLEDDDDEDDEEDDDEEEISDKKEVVTIDSSSDDDCIVLSDDGEDEETTDDDPQNSGLHVNDTYNVPDDQGRVVINIGHPEGEPDVFVAPQISRIIKPHQIGGVRFLFDNIIESLDRFDSSTGFGCILAHSMGLGKTLQLVCFCDIFLRHTSSKTVLCIMPINTLQNWMAEFNMWLPEDPEKSPARLQGEVRPRNFKLHVLNDSHKSLNARSKVVLEWANEGGVLLIGYEMYRLLSLKKMTKKKRNRKTEIDPEIEKEESEEHKKLLDEMHAALVKPGPDLVICDEGHRIKNSHASISLALKQIKSKRRIVLTGYPLQNNLQEYWCMVDFVRPNYLGTKTEFANMFERPIQNGQCIDSTPQDIKLMRYRAHVLHSLLLGFVQRRSHAVLQTSLPQKEEYVMLVRMTEFQRKLYDVFMNDVVRTKAVPNPLKAFAVCCKIWNHPDVLYNFLKKREADLDLELEEVESAANGSITSAGSGNNAKGKKSPAVGRRSRKKGVVASTTPAICDDVKSKPAATITPNSGTTDNESTTNSDTGFKIENKLDFENSNQNSTNSLNEHQVVNGIKQEPSISSGTSGNTSGYNYNQQPLPQQQLQSNLMDQNKIANINSGYSTMPYGSSGGYGNIQQPNHQQQQMSQYNNYGGYPMGNNMNYYGDYNSPYGGSQTGNNYYQQSNQSFPSNDSYGNYNSVQGNNNQNQYHHPSHPSGNNYWQGGNQNSYYGGNNGNQNSANMEYNQSNYMGGDYRNTSANMFNQNYNNLQNQQNYESKYTPNPFEQQQQQQQQLLQQQTQQQQHQQTNQPQRGPDSVSQQQRNMDTMSQQQRNIESLSQTPSWAPPNNQQSSQQQLQTMDNDKNIPNFKQEAEKRSEIVDMDTKEIKLENSIKTEESVSGDSLSSVIKSESDIKNESGEGIIIKEEKDDNEKEKEIVKTKEDGIPYDWAVDLMKGYIPDLLENSPKMEIFFCILEESLRLGDRMLVFSQSLLTLNLIEKFLQKTRVFNTEAFWAKNLNYYRLDGSTTAIEREKLINEFNSNPNIHLFLVSTRAGSLGINLVGANRVVVFDASWNPCHDTQAVCRVYRYGQKKPCFVYRLVMDNCLEKRIYDRQVNKQGMSDRVVDECNPDAHLSLKEVTNLCWDDDKDTEIKDFSDSKDKYIDIVMQKILEQHSKYLSKEPFHHESLLVDRKEKKLSSAEKRLAKRGYELEKQAAAKPSYIYNTPGTQYRAIRTPDGSIVHRPVASVRPMQAELGDKTIGQQRTTCARPTRWIPAEVWQRQGMTAQEMTLPLDVVIPTSSAEKSNIVLKAGQKVMVLKSPKGIYMQLETGKIIAIRTAFKMGQKDGKGGSTITVNNRDAIKKITGASLSPTANTSMMNMSTANLPGNLKNNSSITVIPTKQGLKSGPSGILTKIPLQGIMRQKIQGGVGKNVQLGTARPYNLKQGNKLQGQTINKPGNIFKAASGSDSGDISNPEESEDKIFDESMDDKDDDLDGDVDKDMTNSAIDDESNSAIKAPSLMDEEETTVQDESASVVDINKSLERQLVMDDKSKEFSLLSNNKNNNNNKMIDEKLKTELNDNTVKTNDASGRCNSNSSDDVIMVSATDNEKNNQNKVQEGFSTVGSGNNNSFMNFPYSYPYHQSQSQPLLQTSPHPQSQSSLHQHPQPMSQHMASSAVQQSQQQFPYYNPQYYYPSQISQQHIPLESSRQFQQSSELSGSHQQPQQLQSQSNRKSSTPKIINDTNANHDPFGPTTQSDSNYNPNSNIIPFSKMYNTSQMTQSGITKGKPSTIGSSIVIHDEYDSPLRDKFSYRPNMGDRKPKALHQPHLHQPHNPNSAQQQHNQQQHQQEHTQQQSQQHTQQSQYMQQQQQHTQQQQQQQHSQQQQPQHMLQQSQPQQKSQQPQTQQQQSQAHEIHNSMQVHQALQQQSPNESTQTQQQQQQTSQPQLHQPFLQHLGPQVSNMQPFSHQQSPHHLPPHLQQQQQQQQLHTTNPQMSPVQSPLHQPQITPPPTPVNTKSSLKNYRHKSKQTNTRGNNSSSNISLNVGESLVNNSSASSSPLIQTPPTSALIGNPGSNQYMQHHNSQQQQHHLQHQSQNLQDTSHDPFNPHKQISHQMHTTKNQSPHSHLTYSQQQQQQESQQSQSSATSTSGTNSSYYTSPAISTHTTIPAHGQNSMQSISGSSMLHNSSLPSQYGIKSLQQASDSFYLNKSQQQQQQMFHGMMGHGQSPLQLSTPLIMQHPQQGQQSKYESSLQFLEKSASSISESQSGFKTSLSNITRPFSPAPRNDPPPPAKTTGSSRKSKKQQQLAAQQQAQLAQQQAQQQQQLAHQQQQQQQQQQHQQQQQQQQQPPPQFHQQLQHEKINESKFSQMNYAQQQSDYQQHMYQPVPSPVHEKPSKGSRTPNIVNIPSPFPSISFNNVPTGPMSGMASASTTPSPAIVQPPISESPNSVSSMHSNISMHPQQSSQQTPPQQAPLQQTPPQQTTTHQTPAQQTPPPVSSASPSPISSNIHNQAPALYSSSGYPTPPLSSHSTLHHHQQHHFGNIGYGAGGTSQLPPPSLQSMTDPSSYAQHYPPFTGFSSAYAPLPTTALSTNNQLTPQQQSASITIPTVPMSTSHNAMSPPVVTSTSTHTKSPANTVAAVIPTTPMFSPSTGQQQQVHHQDQHLSSIYSTPPSSSSSSSLLTSTPTNVSSGNSTYETNTPTYTSPGPPTVPPVSGSAFHRPDAIPPPPPTYSTSSYTASTQSSQETTSASSTAALYASAPVPPVPFNPSLSSSYHQSLPPQTTPYQSPYAAQFGNGVVPPTTISSAYHPPPSPSHYGYPPTHYNPHSYPSAGLAPYPPPPHVIPSSPGQYDPQRFPPPAAVDQYSAFNPATYSTYPPYNPQPSSNQWQ